MTIGLICAIPQELAHLRAALDSAETVEVAHVRFDRGRLDGHEVVLVGAGIGKVNTALVATLLADRFGCRLIVFSGVAGGLDPSLRIGDVVIADRTLQHDAGVIEDERLPTYQAGHVPFFNPTDRLGYPVDAGAARAASGAAGRLRPAAAVRRRGWRGRAAADRVRHDPVRRPVHPLRGARASGCFASSAGAAVEMEGGALGQVAEAFAIPYLDIRALSDLAGQRFALRLRRLRLRGRRQLGR